MQTVKLNSHMYENFDESFYIMHSSIIFALTSHLTASLAAAVRVMSNVHRQVECGSGLPKLLL